MAWVMVVVLDSVLPDKWAHFARIVAGHAPTAFLKALDPNADDGRGAITTTTRLADAMRFDSFEAVMRCWKTQSTTRPLRPDGKPNRPLTAHTIEPRELPPEATT